MLVRALHAAGVPPDALALLPGYGEAGAALVRDPRVHTIAFTGSGAVGLEIVRAAAETPDGQGHVKRVVAEMGGKNCVIVDSDADLDEAVPELVGSAFGYAGQKCSAAARVLVHEAVADELLERLAGAAAVLAVGQAERVRHRRAAGDRAGGAGAGAALRDAWRPSEGTIAAQRGAGPRRGLVLRAGRGRRPARGLARRCARRSSGRCWRSSACEDMEAACDLVDALPFALTGGLFSRSPATVEAVARRTPVGNLYVNRGITGAMVGRQPFGGNRRSGIGSKAGGPDYLLQFVEPRVVTENTMRHGIPVE